MIFIRDFVTRENHWQIASLVTQKSLFTVSHALFFISIVGIHKGVCVEASRMVRYECMHINDL